MKLGENVDFTPPPPPARQLVGRVEWDMPADEDAAKRHAALEARLDQLAASHETALEQNRALQAEVARLRQPRRRRVVRDDNGDITEVIEED